MNQAELEAKLAQLQAENVALKAKMPTPPKPTLKVGKAGGISLYGIGRYPVTLYKSQWEAVINQVDNIKAFIAAHPELKTKE